MKIFITGGTEGLGLELVKGFNNGKNEIHTCSRNKCKNPIDNVFYYQIDINSKNDVSNFFDKGIASDFDILVLNAGYANTEKTYKMNIEDELKNIEINLRSNINFVLRFKNSMNNNSQIYYINSIASKIPTIGLASYGASKIGFDYFSTVFNLHNLKNGIKIKNIYFGFLKTRMTYKNKHPMLFIENPQKAAKWLIKKIYSQRYFQGIYPYPLIPIVWLFKIAPFFVLKFLMNFKFFNHLK